MIQSEGSLTAGEPDELDLGCSQLLPETGELTLSEPPQVLTIPGKTLCLVQRLPPESLQKWSVDEKFSNKLI